MSIPFSVNSGTHKCTFRNKMYIKTQLPRVRLCAHDLLGYNTITELIAEGLLLHVPQGR